MGLGSFLKRILGGRKGPFAEVAGGDLDRLWQARASLTPRALMQVRDELVARGRPFPLGEIATLYSPSLPGLDDVLEAESLTLYLRQMHPRHRPHSTVHVHAGGALVECGDGAFLHVRLPTWRHAVPGGLPLPEGARVEAEVLLDDVREPMEVGRLEVRPLEEDGARFLEILDDEEQLRILVGPGVPLPALGGEAGMASHVIGGLRAPPTAEDVRRLGDLGWGVADLVQVERIVLLPEAAGTSCQRSAGLAALVGLRSELVGGGLPVSAEVQPALAAVLRGEWDAAAHLLDEIRLAASAAGPERDDGPAEAGEAELEGAEEGEGAGGDEPAPPVADVHPLVDLAAWLVTEGRLDDLERVLDASQASSRAGGTGGRPPGQAFGSPEPGASEPQAERRRDLGDDAPEVLAYYRGLLAELRLEPEASCLEHYEQAADRGHAPALAQLAYLAGRSGPAGRALELSERWARRADTDLIAHTNHALLVWKSGDATRAYDIVQENQVAQSPWLGNLADCTIQDGDPSKDAFGLLSPAGSFHGPFNAAQGYLRSGSFAEGERLLRRCLELEPNRPGALGCLALHLLESDRHAEALALCDEAIERLHHFQHLRYVRAYANLSSGQPQAAVADLEHILSSAPDHVAARVNLIFALLASGEPEQADEAMRHAEQMYHEGADMALADALRRTVKAGSRRPSSPTRPGSEAT